MVRSSLPFADANRWSTLQAFVIRVLLPGVIERLTENVPRTVGQMIAYARRQVVDGSVNHQGPLPIDTCQCSGVRNPERWHSTRGGCVMRFANHNQVRLICDERLQGFPGRSPLAHCDVAT